MVVFGDVVCRRILPGGSSIYRFASAFLVGLLLSTWITYTAARLFAFSARPLMFGNLIFFAIAVAAILWKRRKASSANRLRAIWTGLKENKADAVVTGALLVVALWLMFSSFNMQGGKLQIANHQWSDFGPNVAIMQSFALGRNFPTEYPHFAGDRIRYHFLFYFQAGNLEYLGLNAAWSNNILSVLSLLSMLILLIELGTLLFQSRAVGYLGAALFFFHGSLNYLLFLRRQHSFSDAVAQTRELKAFLPSGFPYRGEDWGVWSLVNFINQRHFASAIGILLLVIIFIVVRLREERQWPRHAGRFVVVGALIGLLPMWNGAVFIAAAAVLGMMFVLFPLRRELFVLGLAAGIVALPQIVYLKTGAVRAGGYSLFHWGYTVDNPTIINTTRYLAWTFGFKWLLIALALFWAAKLPRRLALAVSSLLAIAFLFQFSEEVLANHKFLNIWLIIANLFVAFGLWRLWRMTVKGSTIAGKAAAVALVVLITLGGAIDLFPIRNAYWVEIPFENDRLVRWVKEETDPRAVFLTDRFVTHRIMLAGRRIFHGWPYYTWGAGYLTDERDQLYKRLFEERDPNALLNLLRQNNISYVAFDHGVRNGGFVKDVNEPVYEAHFQKVFNDANNEYDQLSIFKIPETGELKVTAPAGKTTAASVFNAGTGSAPGKFDKPRGLSVDSSGNLYVADGGNSRIQKFSAKGEFLATFGRPGTGSGELREPSGVAVDASGEIYVTDSTNQRLLRFNADGTPGGEWNGPGPGFLGPRDVAIGSDRMLYVLDQGRARVVKLNRDGQTLAEWGRKGSADGEFENPTGLTVAADRVYVADAGNNRIQIFDTDGKFIGQWPIPRWEKYIWHFPDIAVDVETRRIYVTSGWTREVLVLDLDGNYLESIKSEGGQGFNNISAIVVVQLKSEKSLYVLNTGTYAVEAGHPRVSRFDLAR